MVTPSAKVDQTQRLDRMSLSKVELHVYAARHDATSDVVSPPPVNFHLIIIHRYLKQIKSDRRGLPETTISHNTIAVLSTIMLSPTICDDFNVISRLHAQRTSTDDLREMFFCPITRTNQRRVSQWARLNWAERQRCCRLTV